MKYIVTESQKDMLVFNYIDSLLNDLYIVKDGSDAHIWLTKGDWEKSKRPIFSYYSETEELGILPSLIMGLSSFFSLNPTICINKFMDWFGDKFKQPVAKYYIM
jgi:hypothetical protein